MSPSASSSHADLLAAVRESLNSAGCRGRLIVAISGGADSTALLLALHRIAPEHSLELTAAHLDHGLRKDSRDDAAWVATLCDRLQIPLVRQTLDANALQSGGAGLEESARKLRRGFLAETARQQGARWIAAAHTADDQAETVLHRILRGTGMRGLAGIAPVSPLGEGIQIIRPLLDVSRAQVELWLHELRQDWRVDSTNLDTRHTRNRIRHNLLPLLRSEYNPQVDAALRRLAAQCQAAAEDISALAGTALESSLLEAASDHVRLDCDPLATLSDNLRREVGMQLWRRQGWPEQGMTFQHWDRLANLLSERPSEGSLSLPGGVQATRSGKLARIERLRS